MTLRVRLLLTSMAVAVPLASGLFLINDRLRQADMRERLTQFAETELSSGIADRCRDNNGLQGRPGPLQGRPDDRPWPGGDGRGMGRGGRRPPPRPQSEQRPYDIYSYAADFTATSPSGPALDVALRTALGAQDSAVAPYANAEGMGLQMALWINRTGGNCSVLLLQLRPRRGERRDQIASLALVTFSAMLAAWIAAGPVISRMRRLQESVRRSADTRYATPVPVEGGDEVASLAEAFNDAGKRVRRHLVELQQREDGLRQFVANTAHDVGLPLTVLQGHLADLSHGSSEAPHNPAHAKRIEHVQAAMQEAHYLGSLIRNLSAATRLDAVGTPLERHSVDLCALVDRVVARHAVVARAGHVELNHAVPEVPVSVLAEVTLLEQAVSNLVDNAIRHNHEGGHVAIVLDPTADGFALTVTDDGPGVPPADLARLTERWFRADDARTRRPDGQGLGLAIAAESLKQLGFELTFSGPVEGGLRAEITGT